MVRWVGGGWAGRPFFRRSDFVTQSLGMWHVGIVMDGNGRWAEARGLDRSAGHRAGARAAERIIEAAPGLGVGTLTLFAFSRDNWKRPAAEVRALMMLLDRELRRQTARCERHGIELTVIGRRDRLPRSVTRAIERAETLTRGGATLRLRLAVDYSARESLVRAAAELAPRSSDPVSEAEFALALARAEHAERAAPPVDVFIRTGGEQRLSDFLLWESAYAELFFRSEAWPDFGPEALASVLAEFRRRERRFGGLGDQGAETHFGRGAA